MYYRVASQVDPSITWQWKSTVLSSLNTILQVLRLYRSQPQDRLWVFSSSTRDGIHGDFHPIIGERELRGSTRSRYVRKDITIMSFAEPYNRVTSTYAFDMSMSALERRRLELELGPGGDHDAPYSFVLPSSMVQVLVWMRILARIQGGELQP